MKVKTSLKAKMALVGIMLFGIINFAVAQDNRGPKKEHLQKKRLLLVKIKTPVQHV